MSLGTFTSLLMLWWGSTKVLRDTSFGFHPTPGVWLLLRVDCDREGGMDAEITDQPGNPR